MTDKDSLKDKKDQITVSLNFKNLTFILIGLYVLTVGIMLYLWQPWHTPLADARQITVSGEAVVEAEPDEFRFNPSYTITAKTKDSAIQQAADKASTVVDELKKLGVEDKDIRVSGYSNNWQWYYDEDDGNHTTVDIVVTTNDKNLSQKVQDYLLTTEPEGLITPQATFSEEKNKELESQARSEAINDAKTKAQASADELEVRIGKVISVDEGYGFDDYPVRAYDAVTSDENIQKPNATQSIPVQTGENEFRYSVTVVFELK